MCFGMKIKNLKKFLIFSPYISIIRIYTGLTFNNPSNRMYLDRYFTQIIVYQSNDSIHIR